MLRPETLTPGELRPGMVASLYGMRVLIDEMPRLTNHAGDRTFAVSGRVLNRAEVPSAVVPFSFTAQSYDRDLHRWVDTAPEHRWTFQGNDLARVAVEVQGPAIR